METNVASVADLVDPQRLRTLATPATLRLGREIVDADGVELTDFGPLVVRGRVRGAEPGTQRRTAELRVMGQTLGWECTCSRDPELFCKHLVALAIVTREQAPKRRDKT